MHSATIPSLCMTAPPSPIISNRNPRAHARGFPEPRNCQSGARDSDRLISDFGPLSLRILHVAMRRVSVPVEAIPNVAEGVACTDLSLNCFTVDILSTENDSVLAIHAEQHAGRTNSLSRLARPHRLRTSAVLSRGEFKGFVSQFLPRYR